MLDGQTHAIVRELNVRDPRGIDITPDGSKVWVATGSRLMTSIETATLAVTSVQLPLFTGFPGPVTTGNVLPGSWEGDRVFALADGALLVYFAGTGSQAGIQPSAVWNPVANTLTGIAPVLPVIVPEARSGDGTEVFLETANSVSCGVSIYSTQSKTVTAGPSLAEPCTFAATNRDGSRLVFASNNKYSVYDASYRRLGDLPGAADVFSSAFLFSPDGATLYELTTANGPAVFHSIDVATLSDRGAAPAMATLPVGVSETPVVSKLFAVDSHGQLLGIQDFGIAFEDPAFYQHYAAQQPGVGPGEVPLTPSSGPLAGGTNSSVFGSFGLTPDVWYGNSRGAAASDAASYSLSITSPASSVPGPVNVKLLFPDGNQLFLPQGFSYGPYPQYSVISGTGPDGGVPGELSGYGLPADASGGTVTVGGANAPIITQKGQYRPYTREPFPSTFLQYTFPSGAPGWADLQVATPDGTGALPKAVFYARSVTDYSSPDSFTAVLYDNKRGQLYLSAGDHIDVFSTRTGQFLAPLQPASQSGARQFAGLALTTDGQNLLAANLLDGSLAVVNPDAPAGSYAIPIAPVNASSPTCKIGPLYVAATSSNLVFVTTGGLPSTACPAEGLTYLASLQMRTAVRPSARSCNIGYASYPITDGFSVDAPADGSYVAIGGATYSSSCIFSTASNSFSLAPGNWQRGLGVAVAGDGNVLASGTSLADPAGNLIGRLAQPVVQFGSENTAPNNEAEYPRDALLRPRLNASGSLYYWAYPHFFDILDVAQGTLRLRFSLAETIQNTAEPLAVDSGGRQVFLITDKGLTVVDLGTPPLSIGHAGPLAGSQLTVRGSGFGPGTKAQIGSEPAGAAFIDDSTLTLTLPALGSGAQDLTLTNPDGMSYTLQSAVLIP